MTTRNIYLTKVFLALGLSLLLTFLLITSSLAITPLFAQNQEDPYRVETFGIDTPGELEVQTSGGHITVEGSSSDDVRVEMYVRKDGDYLLPEDTNLDNWEIDISQSGNVVNVVATREKNKWGPDSESISFVVYAPRELSTELKTSGGHIKASGLSGEQSIKTSGGHLNLADLEGSVKARTSGGHIDIADTRGDVDARTSGGHINVQNSEGRLGIRTSGGHIDLADVGGSVEARTSGGSISAHLNSISDSINLRTSGGNINIGVPENTGLNLNLRGNFVSTDMNNFSGAIDQNEVEGKLNGGGPIVSARTSGGRVSLSFH